MNIETNLRLYTFIETFARIIAFIQAKKICIAQRSLIDINQ